MEAKTKAWLDAAREDLNTAKYNFKGKHCLWAIFLCQQALEKALKAVYFEQAGEVPPRKHDLVVLTNIANLTSECDEARLDFLRRLSVYYLESRYPEERAELAAKCTEQFTKDIVTRTEVCSSYQQVYNP